MLQAGRKPVPADAQWQANGHPAADGLNVLLQLLLMLSLLNLYQAPCLGELAKTVMVLLSKLLRLLLSKKAVLLRVVLA